MKTDSLFYRIVRCITWYICRVLPISKKKIVFSSYYGGGYSDNNKYIAENLLNDDLELYWFVKSHTEAQTLPQGIKYCKLGSVSWAYHMSTAAVWVDNCRSGFKFKRPNQLYIQTWHGGGAMKRVEKDVEDKLSPEYVLTAKKDAKYTDLMIAGDRFGRDLFKNSFWYDGPVALLGCPRYDILLRDDNGDIEKKVRSFFALDDNIAIALYAPTFRHDRSFAPYNIDFAGVLNCLEKRFKKKFVFLIHLHPNIATSFRELHYSDNVINATFYPDMQELLAASDVLFGDYSSVNNDFSLMKKPVFMYAADIDAYKMDRDFYINLDELPFPIAKNNQELIENITCFNEKKYAEDLDVYFEKIGAVFNPDASAMCADIIRQHIAGGCNKKMTVRNFQNYCEQYHR